MFHGKGLKWSFCFDIWGGHIVSWGVKLFFFGCRKVKFLMHFSLLKLVVIDRITTGPNCLNIATFLDLRIGNIFLRYLSGIGEQGSDLNLISEASSWVLFWVALFFCWTKVSSIRNLVTKSATSRKGLETCFPFEYLLPNTL